jgi:hypothetical protein
MADQKQFDPDEYVRQNAGTFDPDAYVAAQQGSAQKGADPLARQNALIDKMQAENLPIPSYYGFTPGNVLKNIGSGVKGLVSGTYELGKSALPELLTKDPLSPTWAVGTPGHPTTVQKFIVDPYMQETQRAGELAQQNRWLPAYGHSFASLIPMVGPWAASLGEQAGRGDVGGAVGQAVGATLVPKLAGTAVQAGMRGVAPVFSRSAIGLTDRDMGFGARPDIAALKETKGIGMKPLAASTRARLGQLGAAARAEYTGKPASIQPAIDVLQREEQAALNARRTDLAKDIRANIDRLSTDPVTGQPSVNVPAEQLWAIKTGQGDITNWNPNTDPSVAQRIERDVYGAMKDELNRAALDAQPFIDRYHNLKPVALRADIRARGPGVLGSAAERLARPTGGAAVGIYELLKGNVPGALAAILGPEALSSPALRMAAARTLWRLGGGERLGPPVIPQLGGPQIQTPQPPQQPPPQLPPVPQGQLPLGGPLTPNTSTPQPPPLAPVRQPTGQLPLTPVGQTPSSGGLIGQVGQPPQPAAPSPAPAAEAIPKVLRPGPSGQSALEVPGMAQAVAEQNATQGKIQGEQLTSAFNQPKGSISGATGQMENAPGTLFGGREEVTGQKGMFGEAQPPAEQAPAGAQPPPPASTAAWSGPLRPDGTPVDVPSDEYVLKVPVKSLRTNPDKFQYKGGMGPGGVSDKLKGSESWDPAAGGAISVWRDPATGVDYVVNGHHRYDHALRMGRDTIDVRYIDAANAHEAMVKGAIQNIRENQGTAIDAAKIFRVAPEGADKIVEMIGVRSRMVDDARALANLSEPIWEKVYRGDVDPNIGRIIGANVSTPEGQRAALTMLEGKGRSLTDQEAEFAIRYAKSGSITREEATLFGTEEITRSLAVEKAQLAGDVMKALSSERNIFAAVSRGSKEIGERGVGTVDEEQARLIARNAGEARQLFVRLSDKVGPVGDALTQAGERLAQGGNRPEIAKQLIPRVLQGIAETYPGGAREAARMGKANPAETGTPERVGAEKLDVGDNEEAAWQEAVKSRIRAAFPLLLKRDTAVGDAARIADLKDLLADINPAEVNKALVSMRDNGEVSLQGIESIMQTTQRDRDAAIKVLGQDRNIFYLQPRPRR